MELHNVTYDRPRVCWGEHHSSFRTRFHFLPRRDRRFILSWFMFSGRFCKSCLTFRHGWASVESRVSNVSGPCTWSLSPTYVLYGRLLSCHHWFGITICGTAWLLAKLKYIRSVWLLMHCVPIKKPLGQAWLHKKAEWRKNSWKSRAFRLLFEIQSRATYNTRFPLHGIGITELG